MPSPFKTRKFLRLFRKWNERLKQDGFKDAEDFNHPDHPLKCWHSFKFKAATKDNREQYYNLATALLTNGFKFGTDLSRRVWELHCYGKSVRQIETIIQSQLIGYKGRKKTNVHTIILEIQHRSGIKR